MRKRTHGSLMVGALLLGACASSRSVELRLTDGDGVPMHGALVNASPIGLSVSPLPVSGDNIREAEIERGTGGVTDRSGAVRLALESPFEYEIRVQPNPLSDEASVGVAWLWTIREDGSIIERGSRSDGRVRPVLTVLD